MKLFPEGCFFARLGEEREDPDDEMNQRMTVNRDVKVAKLVQLWNLEKAHPIGEHGRANTTLLAELKRRILINRIAEAPAVLQLRANLQKATADAEVRASHMCCRRRASTRWHVCRRSTVYRPYR